MSPHDPPAGAQRAGGLPVRRPMRGLRALVPTAALSASLVVGPFGRAAASDPGDVAPPSDPTESGCGGTIGWVKVFVTATSPTQHQGAVRTHGSISQSPSWYCYQEHGEVSAQSKVCGFWGCNWDTRAVKDGAVQATYWSRVVDQKCRSGKNRYRSRSSFHYRVIDASGGIPVLVPGPPMVGGVGTAEPEFTCK